MKPYIDDYNTLESVRRYVFGTAGKGIEYLLENVYGPIYIEQIEDMLKEGVIKNKVKLLEFGCGGGMNLIYLIKRLSMLGIPVEVAYGTDYSELMIEAAKKMAEKHLDNGQRKIVDFFVVSNEALHHELAKSVQPTKNKLNEFFHLIIGINTFRYCLQINKSKKCALDIFNLLVKGGRLVIIDMNNKHPYYLANFRYIIDKIRGDASREKIPYYLRKILNRQYDLDLPTLEEYCSPFESSGFEILKKDNLSWIPHSARNIRLKIWKQMSPLLDKVAKSHSMRSLVIAKKTWVTFNALKHLKTPKER